MKLTPFQKEHIKWLRYHGWLFRNSHRWCGRKSRTKKQDMAWERVCHWSEISGCYPEDREVISDYMRKHYERNKNKPSKFLVCILFLIFLPFVVAFGPAYYLLEKWGYMDSQSGNEGGWETFFYIPFLTLILWGPIILTLKLASK